MLWNVSPLAPMVTAVTLSAGPLVLLSVLAEPVTSACRLCGGKRGAARHRHRDVGDRRRADVDAGDAAAGGIGDDEAVDRVAAGEHHGRGGLCDSVGMLGAGCAARSVKPPTTSALLSLVRICPLSSGRPPV